MEKETLLFLGRVAPIKNLEVVIQALPLIKNKNLNFEIVGPCEKEYKAKLTALIKNLGVQERVSFSPPIYNTPEKIKKIDSAKICILPSTSEGMPQSLIECLARKKIVIASKINASLDLIEDRKNGFLFSTKDEKDLAKKIDFVLSLNKDESIKIKNNARKSVEKFSWNKIMKRIEKTIKKDNKDKPKILELCDFSSGICGVFNRVKEESKGLKSKGYEVSIFSSNISKGTNEISQAKDEIEGIKIKRFPATKLGGESFMHWNFKDAALKYGPDTIIAHAYRHPHTTKALKIGKKLNAKVILVTHAPFDRDETRNLIQKKSVEFYDKFIGPKTLKRFDKIISITEWEMPFLAKLGVDKKEIEYIPNGISEEFFK